MMKISFVNRGVKDQGELNIQKPIVYVSESSIKAMSYSGDSSKIRESTTFSESFKDKLVSINGYVSLGNTGRELKNIHVYSSKAVRLDGVERICYLQQADDQLLVSEYSGNRGAKYSALYNVLIDKLKDEGFVASNRKFVINEADIQKFVSCVNAIDDQRKHGMYQLVAISDVDAIVIDKVYYYYNKAYWREIGPGSVECEINTEEEHIEAVTIDQAIAKLIKLARSTSDKLLLEHLGEKIETLSKIVASRIKNLQEIEDLVAKI